MKKGSQVSGFPYPTMISNTSSSVPIIPIKSYLIEGNQKMKTFLSFLLIFSFAFVGEGLGLSDLSLFGNWFTGGGAGSPCNGCPIRNCVNDRAVVLGYCCGCARVSDFLPIDCPALHLSCPVDGRRLCRDYDYMLNCCC